MGELTQRPHQEGYRWPLVPPTLRHNPHDFYVVLVDSGADFSIFNGDLS